MANFELKRVVLHISLGTFLTLGTLPCSAQTLSMGMDPEVLVSPGASLGNNSGQNLESALVDIKAVDAPALGINNGKIAVASVERYGQGIIIDSSGIIATNRHIIGNSQLIYVKLSGGKIFTATVLRQSQADLCLIKVNVPFPLRAISLADPSEIKIGNNVIAVANAGSDPQRMHSGQVINVFKGTSSNNVELMEMNITLKPGDSGGPILNEQGSLLGLIMGKQISDPTKSYAIALNRIQQEYFKYRNSILN